MVARAGDPQGVPYRIRTWDDVNRTAFDVGFDPTIVRWAGDRLAQITRAAGPPPHAPFDPTTLNYLR